MADSIFNSITLSSDLSTLYLIDNGRAISFDLKHKNGIVIGTLNGQLTVATALPDIFVPPVDDDTEEPDTPEEDPPPLEGPIQRLAARPRTLRLPTKGAHWTLMFIEEKAVISIIGASDIDVSIIGASDIDVSIIGASDIDVSLARPNLPEVEEKKENISERPPRARRPKCQIYSFRIAKQTINLRRTADALLIQY